MAVGSLELIRPMTGLVLHPAACPHTLLTQVTPRCLGWGSWFVIADNSTTRKVVLVYMLPGAERRVSSEFSKKATKAKYIYQIRVPRVVNSVLHNLLYNRMFCGAIVLYSLAYTIEVFIILNTKCHLSLWQSFL